MIVFPREEQSCDFELVAVFAMFREDFDGYLRVQLEASKWKWKFKKNFVVYKSKRAIISGITHLKEEGGEACDIEMYQETLIYLF